MKDIFVSKIKRLAVAMFAALCVGNVWGDSFYTAWDYSAIGIPAQTEYSKYGRLYIETKNHRITQAGAVAFEYDLNQSKYDNKSQTYSVTVTYTISNRNITIQTEEPTVTLANNGYSDLITSEYKIEGVQNGDMIEIVVNINGDKGIRAILKDTVKFVNFGDLISTWEMGENKNFIFNGFNFKGWVRAKLHYVLNGDALGDNCATKEVNIENDTFKIAIPYTVLGDRLRWKLELFDSTGGSSIYENIEGISEFLLERQEGYVVYEWKADKTSGFWDDYTNWVADKLANYGYPGTMSRGNYISSVVFNSNADVDLNEKVYYLLDDNRGFSMAEGVTVKIKNGTLGFQPHNDGNAVPLNFGQKNSVLHLNNVEMPYREDKPNTEYVLRLVSGSTIILEGNKVYNWRFRPQNANTKLKVQNGVIQTKYDPIETGSPGNGTEVEIENGVWVVKTYIERGNMGCPDGLAMKTIFRDGPDRQAQLMFRDSINGSTDYDLKLVGTYDFKPSNKTKATYAAAPYLIAGGLRTGDACTISLDVSDLEGYAKIPLMEFKTVDSNVTTAMNTLVNDESKLIVTANGRNVKNRQRARLEWDESAKTLYYSQDPIKGFRVIVR